MALLFRNGFDLTTTISHLFQSSNLMTIATGGRNGGNALRLESSGSLNSGSATRNLGGTYATVGVAVALNVISIPATLALLTFMDNGTAQATLTLTSDGLLHFTGTSATAPLTFNAYQHLEVWATIGNTTGSVTVKVNGVTVLTASAIDTQQTANAYATQVKFTVGVPGNGNNIFFDDLHIMDNSGSNYNTFIGDLRVIEQLPTGDVTPKQFTPSTGTDLYAMVNESPPDSDTSHIDDSTVADAALFTFPNLPVTTGTITSVGIVWFGEKTDAGTRTIKGSCKSSATLAHGSDWPMPSSYGYSPMDATEDFVTDPNTSSAWTVAGVNAASFGVTVVA